MLFEEHDKGFWSSVYEVVRAARKPIILTSSGMCACTRVCGLVPNAYTPYACAIAMLRTYLSLYMADPTLELTCGYLDVSFCAPSKVRMLTSSPSSMIVNMVVLKSSLN